MSDVGWQFSRRAFLRLPVLLPLGARLSRADAGHHVHYDHVIGTSFDLVVWTSSPCLASRVEDAVLEEVERLAAILDTRNPHSEISAIERRSGRAPSSDLAALLAAYDHWEDRTAGTVSIRPTGPTGSRSVDALGKAYIIDRALEAGRRVAGGVEGIVLNIGGDLAACGRPCWVAVTNPAAPFDHAPPLTEVLLADGAIATSGPYARGAHLLNARTGRPVVNAASATVLAGDAVTANALALSWCIAADSDAGLALLADTKGAEGLRIAADGTFVRTPGWSRRERLVLVQAGASTWPAGHQVTLSLTLTQGAASSDGVASGYFGGRGRRGARRPYVAVWIENDAGQVVRVLACWGDRPRYFAELSAFWRAMNRDGSAMEMVARATRPPGTYTLAWDGFDEQRAPVPPGVYRVSVETSQENGVYAARSGTIACGAAPSTGRLSATANFDAVTLQYGPPPARA